MEISGQSTALCVIFITHVLGFPTRGLKIDKNKKTKKRGRERQFSGEWEGGREERRRMSE